MLIILSRCLKMLNSQIEAQGATFIENGGFSERLTAKRVEARDGAKAGEPAPACPLCNASMRKRSSAKGAFWGCSAYPTCKGIRPF